MTGSFYREFFRPARLFLGVVIHALGVVMILNSNLGFPPWDVFHQGVALNLGLTIGKATILVSVIVVAIAVYMKESVGLGTLCNMIFVGVFVDIVMLSGWVPLMHGFVSGLAMMIGGLFIIAVATFIYLGAGYGAGPRDSLMVVLTKRTGKPVGLCRSCIESVVLFTGWLLGGFAGWGTLISVLGIGVVVQIVFYVLRFDVKTIYHETCYETYMRLRNTDARG